MLRPETWPLVIGVALGFVAVAGAVMQLVTAGGPFGWVIVALAALSAVGALAIWNRGRRPDLDPDVGDPDVAVQGEDDLR